jgi:DNA polymerase-1
MNLAYRSHMSHFEAKTSTDLYSGMFYGFTRTIQSLKKKYRQYKFIVVWDHKPDHKYELLPTYKSGRTKLPDKIFNQVGDLKILLSNIAVDQYEKKGQEADDVIASIVESFKDSEGTEDIIIYTNDNENSLFVFNKIFQKEKIT